jgi:hypothetical protein
MSDIDSPADRSVKITHLVFGLFFLGLAGAWALVEADVINTDSLAVLAPGVLIIAGAIGLAASLANNRNRRSRGTDHYAPQDDRTTYPEQGGYDDHEPTEEIR